jgi:hypothetical protein
MNITIKINTDNDAFSQNMNYETSRILEVLVKKLRRDEIDVHVGESVNLSDWNGNTIGSFEVTR